jgi:hypothetical protein
MYLCLNKIAMSHQCPIIKIFKFAKNFSSQSLLVAEKFHVKVDPMILKFQCPVSNDPYSINRSASKWLPKVGRMTSLKSVSQFALSWYGDAFFKLWKLKQGSGLEIILRSRLETNMIFNEISRF